VIAFSRVLEFPVHGLFRHYRPKKVLSDHSTVIVPQYSPSPLGGRNVWSLMGDGILDSFMEPHLAHVRSLCTDFFPKRDDREGFGLMTIFYGVGSMSSPPLTGYLADATEPSGGLLG
jgi:hypothetical protein